MWQKTKNIYHLGQALAAHTLYGFPVNGMTFIGVTGTDGKTTTSSMIYHILHRTGLKAALISTVAAIIDEKPYDTGFHVTTPDPWMVTKYIKLAKKAGAKYVVLETTSHALDQNRVFGIPFAIGVITNVTHEHLDYHKTYENYIEAKYKLLKYSRVQILNRDDDSYQKISNLKSQISKKKIKNKKVVTYGLGNNSDVNPKTFPFKTNLLGDFNQYNCLAAIAVCLELGIDEEIIRAALLDFTAPEGRSEIVYPSTSSGKTDFKVMIDFAHTPNSIEQILSSLRKSIQKGRIIHVFGSAGARDASKRPLMGKASDKYADIIILTAEDPRREFVDDISGEIVSGIENKELRIKNKGLYKINDRQEAIDKAISLAKKGDIVVITGKGHEKSMNLGKGEIPWSDHEAVKKALGRRNLI
ncbi:MAG TPA: UDP-N-acetylmuramoyl-L-alanyl-D-glutamate--2,6-diaminopimelate ligase [Patescibacteria group bacterium]|nr:UDP-N-acetylmuramoyl-L-alanyl-D-glutamate--2,6-diaminopimelate ligase [Patescibacteria group bacterium]